LLPRNGERTSKFRNLLLGKGNRQCGITHLPPGTWEPFNPSWKRKILEESGVSSGRSEELSQICGKSALEYINRVRGELDEVKSSLKSQDPISAIDRLKKQIRELKGEIKSLESSNRERLTSSKIGDIDVIIDEVERGDIKSIIDEAKNRYKKIAIMLFQKKGDRVLLASGVKGVDNIKAGDWIREVAPVVGGGGGGRADFAQAGGKDTSKIKEAKEKALGYLKDRI